MNCTNCGNNLPENSAFCPNCGSPVQVAQTQPTPQRLVTPQPVYNEQTMYQPPINNEQAIYQPPVNNEQTMYQSPVNNEQAIYQQPVNNEQAIYQQSVNNEQAIYQQPVNNATNMYQQGYNPYVAPQQKKSKAPWIALGVSLFLLIVIVAIVIVLLVSCGPDQSTPDAASKEFIEAISENNSDDALELLYPGLISQYELEGNTADAFYIYVRSSILSDFSNVDLTFSNIKITDREVISASRIADANQEMAGLNGYIPISSGVELTGTLMNDSLMLFTWYADVVLADGDYYIVDFYLDLDLDLNYGHNYDY